MQVHQRHASQPQAHRLIRSGGATRAFVRREPYGTQLSRQIRQTCREQRPNALIDHMALSFMTTAYRRYFPCVALQESRCGGRDTSLTNSVCLARQRTPHPVTVREMPSQRGRCALWSRLVPILLTKTKGTPRSSVPREHIREQCDHGRAATHGRRLRQTSTIFTTILPTPAKRKYPSNFRLLPTHRRNRRRCSDRHSLPLLERPKPAAPRLQDHPSASKSDSRRDPKRTRCKGYKIVVPK